MPADDEAGTVVTARALTITARDSDTCSPGTAGLKCEESVLTGESLPAEKLPEPYRIPGRAAQVLHGPWSRCLRPFGLLSVRGDLGSLDVRCLHRR